MKKQSYQHYKMYYVPHHFILLPILCSLIGVGIIKIFRDQSHQLEWLLFSILSFCILYLAIMLRQHYALGNQDRIVRLEFRLRYFETFGSSASSIEKQLSFGQIAALRFAGDEDFKQLLGLALKEKMSAENIKKNIRDWQADDMRV